MNNLIEQSFFKWWKLKRFCETKILQSRNKNPTNPGRTKNLKPLKWYNNDTCDKEKIEGTKNDCGVKARVAQMVRNIEPECTQHIRNATSWSDGNACANNS